MTTALLVAGLAVWAAGAVVDLSVGATVRWARVAPYWAGAAGAALVTAAGVRTVLAPARTIDLGTVLGTAHALVRLDPLAGLFLTLTSGLGVAVSLCMASWARPDGRVNGHGTGAGHLLLLGSVTVVVVAGDAFTFLFAWESLTVAFVILTAVGHRQHRAAQASWVTGVLGQAGGAAVLVGFLLLAGHQHNLAIAAWSHVTPGAVHDAAFALLVVGFGAKVGMVPFEVWLPVGYPAAPGPTRAAMAGLAANAGFYGLWRTFGILGRPPQWLVVVVLVIGGVTALLGIVFAAVQSDLARVIAFSSVENAGIILVGYGVALTGAATGHRDLVAVGLLAASLQVLAHAVAKSGLFASSSFFEADLGSGDLEHLRGVGRRHPASAATFAIGSLTLAGLPPTIGFVSEWMILEALMQEFRVGPLALRLALAAAGALVALTAGIAALTFARLLGTTILGRPVPGSRSPDTVLDGGASGRTGFAILAVACLGFAAVAPWVVRFVADGLGPVVAPHAVTGALRSPWVLQPVFANFSILSPSWLWITMPVGVVVVFGAALALSGGRLLRVRRVPAWRSATSGVSGPSSYGPFAYANILRHILGNVLGTQRTTAEVSGGATSPTAQPPARLVVHTTVAEPIVTHLYRPVRALTLRAVAGARAMQSGRLDAYVGYMLVALVIVLAVVAALG